MNTAQPFKHDRPYINVMEGLVFQEIMRQFRDMPRWFRQSRKLEEVIAYTLNRLPTLYASSQKGWQHQQQLAQRDFKDKIRETVREAFLMTRPDPLRRVEPLNSEHLPDQEVVLQALGTLFQTPTLTWSTALVMLNELKKQPGDFAEKLAALPAEWQPSPQPVRRDYWRPN